MSDKAKSDRPPTTEEYLKKHRTGDQDRKLEIDQLDADPIEQFRLWLNDAIDSEEIEPLAMTVATATREGKPSARLIILRGVDEKGFVFYTNYNSRKGLELAANPWGSLVFWWPALYRQVRVEGPVEKITEQESDEYFQNRPQRSQIGAWASNQSHVIDNREVLDLRVSELEKEYEGRDVPRPPHWGGFRLSPNRIKFWQSRPARLHDCFQYHRPDGEKWVLDRLAP